MDVTEIDPRLFHLISMFASVCYEQLGKSVDEQGATATVDLEAARNTIGTLRMLEEKTEGNLAEAEKKLLDDVVGALQEDYAEAVIKAGASA